MFAAFPRWYAAYFSALYTPLVFLLLALIVRGVCFEIRHRSRIQNICYMCDVVLAVSSLLIALLVGIALANFAVGIPLDSNGDFEGNFFDLVKPAALFSGLLGLSLFITSGALYLSLKIEGELQTRLSKVSKIAIIANLILFAIAAAFIWPHSQICAAPFALILIATILVFRQSSKLAFLMVALCTVCCVAGLFFYIYPNVLISSVAENSLTIAGSASSAYTLKIMSIVALIFVPIILAYQILSYYIFRKRISSRDVHSSEV